MTGLFETMLANHGRVIRLEEHFARLERSARELGLPLPSIDHFREAIVLDSMDEMAVRCVYEDGRFSAVTFPVPEITLRRRSGARVVTLDRSVVRDRPRHKLASYMTSRPEIPEGVEEALFVDADGNVLEGTTTNVFAVVGDTLITAGESVLPGIMRAWVIERATRVIERPPTIAELRGGSFLTSSLTLIAPIVQVNGEECRNAGVLAG